MGKGLVRGREWMLRGDHVAGPDPRDLIRGGRMSRECLGSRKAKGARKLM